MSKFSEKAGKVGKLFNVIGAADAGRTLHKDVPLAYCLMLDPNTPMRPKAWMGAKLVFMVVDAPIPFFGEVDAIIAVRSFKAFIEGCERADKALVDQHRAALAAGTSTWDVHTAQGIDMSVAFGQAVVRASEPVRDTVRNVAVPSAEAVRKATAPARDALRRITGRGGKDLG